MSAERKPVDVLNHAIDIANAHATEPHEPLRIVTLRMDEAIALRNAFSKLIDAAGKIDARMAFDGEGPLDRFERLAEMFRSETGYMAPGKSAPTAAYAGEEYERERDAAWMAWSKAPFDDLRGALAAVRGGAKS